MTTDPVVVRPVETKRDLERFIAFPYKHYESDPHWVPPLRIAEHERFDRKKNPFYQHAVVDLFLAERDNRIVGRIAGIDDDNHNATHGDNLAFFGYFEAVDEAVAQALLERVEAWAKARGRDILRGPANPSMNEGSGFQLDAFDTDPYLMMPYNPPVYPQYVEALGYSKAKDLYAWLFDHHSADTDRLARLAARAEKRYHPTVRTVDMKNFDRELGILKRIYNEAWEDNWGFVKYTEAEFDALASELKLILDPNIVVFLEVEGEVAGLAISLPDANQLFKRMQGRLLPLGWIHLLRRRQIINQARLPILGVLKEHRRKGFELILINEIVKRTFARGYFQGECSWILEDNDAMNKGIEAAGAKLYKTYRIYQKTL